MAIAPLPNRRRGSVTLEPVAPEQEEEEVGALADAYAFGVWGQIKDAVEVERQAWQTVDPDFDIGKAIPEGYEAYADAFADALNQDMVDQIKQNIDENLAIRERRDQRGVANTVLNDVVAGVLDPLNVIPVGQLVGVGGRVGAARGVVTIGGLGAGTELVRGSLDDTATAEETAYGVAGSLILGGAMGGLLGKIGSRAGQSVPSQPVTRSITPRQIPPPVRGFRTTSQFGPRRAPRTARGRGSSNHQGVDFATPIGTPVEAYGTGRVTAMTPASSGAGISVTIDFGEGVTTRVMHLSEANVQVGDTVRPGQVYAKTGNTGKSTGPHLHYEVHVNGKPVDPFGDEAFAVLGRPSSPTQAINIFEGLAPPTQIDIDGRGVPVVVGSTGSGSPARFVRARTAADIVDEDMNIAVRQEEPLIERSPSATRDVAPPVRLETNRFDDAGAYLGMPVAEAKAIANSLAEAEGLAGKALTRRSKAIMGEMREHFTGKTKKLPAQSREEIYEDLQQRAMAAADRGDAALADDLFETAGRFAPDDARVGQTALSEEADALVAQRDRARGRDIEVQRGERQPDSGMTRGQMRDAMRASGDEPEVDELPFGVESSAPRSNLQDGDHIVVDVDALLASFASKPWTRAHIEGVQPLADDAFKTPADWVNFAVNHEIEHTVNPRRAGETLAEYENRINARAYQQLLDGQVPFTPEKGLVERLAIAPTPRGQLERLIPDGEALIHSNMMNLADDYAIQTARHAQGGTAAVGGSVFQRSARWMAKLYPVRDSIRREYLAMIGMQKGASVLQIEAALAVRAIPGIRKVLKDPTDMPTLDEFRREVGRAVVGGTEVSVAARNAAAKFTAVMRQTEEAARELGMFQSTKGLRVRADRKERAAASVDRILERFAGRGAANDDWTLDMAKAADDMRAEAASLREMADELVMPLREENYFPRHWNPAVVEERKGEFLEILRRGYAREGHPNPEAAAQGAYETITLDPAGEFSAPGSPASLRHRSVPVTNEEAWDFIEQDAELVMSIYLKRVGGAIEMTRQFGDTHALDTIDVMRADLLSRGVPKEKTEQAIQLFEDARDRITGSFHGKSPLSWDNRAARAIKGFTNLVIFGGIIRSQIGDIARTIGVQGLGVRSAVSGHGEQRPAGLIGGVFAAMVGDLKRYSPGGIAKEAGEALEYVVARNVARMIESDDALIVHRDSAVERWIAKAQAPFFVANGMTPFTVVLKDWAGAVAAHNIINEAQIVAKAIREGGEVDSRMMTRLKANGIDEQDAMILADMPVDRGQSGLILANVEAWEGARGARGREMLLSAVNGEVRRSVTTPGPLERPAIFDGIFHTKKGREEALRNVEQLRSQVGELEGAFRQLARRDEADPDRMAAEKALRDARAELTKARRGVGRAGRMEAPLASLPFQAQSFAMAAGAKITHGVLSGRDRARLTGIVSMMAAGALVTWLKAGDHFDKMGWDEFIYESFDASGMGTWLSSMGSNLDSMLDNPVMPNNEFDPDGKRVGDEIAGAGPAFGVAANLIEPFVSTTMEPDDRVSTVRRGLPFANLIWLQSTVKKLEDVIQGDKERQGSRAMEVSQQLDETEEGAEQPRRVGGGRFGAESFDLRTSEAMEGPSEIDEAGGVIDVENLPTRMTNRDVAKARARVRAERPKRRVKPAIL